MSVPRGRSRGPFRLPNTELFLTVLLVYKCKHLLITELKHPKVGQAVWVLLFS